MCPRFTLLLGVLCMTLLVGCGRTSDPADVAVATPDAALPSATPERMAATPTFVPTPLPATATSEVQPASTSQPPTSTVEPPTATAQPSATLQPPTATAQPTATSQPLTPTGTSAPPTPTVAVPTVTAIVPTPTPVPPTPTPDTPAATAVQASGKIFYLANDGVTINTVRPDGSDVEHVTTIAKQPEEVVVGLAGEPSGTFLLYGLQAAAEQWPRYFLVQRGRATPVAAFTSAPRWSPDGRLFVAQVPEPSGLPGAIYLYDTASRTGRTLPVSGRPDWFPDGRRLVYTANDVFVFDLQTGTAARLTELAGEGDETWGVQEAHVLPDGQHVIFYGAQRKNLGASGNGQQWWSIPVAGGEPRPFADPGGNGVSGFGISPQNDMLAYSEGAHSSACVSIQSVIVTTTDVQPELALALPIPPEIGVTDTGAYFIKGFSWSPDNDHIAYAVEPYRCVEEAEGILTEPPAVYLWNIRTGSGTDPLVPQKVIDGQYPVWIR